MTVDEYLLLKPSMSGPYKFRKRWQTTILTSLTGAEQRSAIFTWPRRSLEFNLSPRTSADLAYLNRVLFKNLHNSWGVPFWQDKTTLTVEALSGQTVLTTADATIRNFEVGALVLIYASRSSYEIGTIGALGANDIIVNDNLVSTWPVGTEIYPIMKAKLQAEQEVDLYDPSKGNIVISAEEDFDSGVTRHNPSISTYPTYYGSLVFNNRPRHTQLKQSFNHPYDFLVFFGKSQSESNWTETSFAMDGQYFLNGLTAIHAFTDFFDYHKGKWQHFWVPTWQNDIVVTVAIGAGDVTLTTDPISYPSYWQGTEGGKFIVLMYPDGTWIYREIISSDATHITLNAATGKACSDLSNLMVCFLRLSRFDIDEIEIDYQKLTIGLSSVRFRSITNASNILFGISTFGTSHATSAGVPALT